MDARLEYPEELLVDSPLGMKNIDSEGSPISGVRLDVTKAYAGIPGLLQRVINNDDGPAWRKITQQIDYIYTNLDAALGGLNQETGFGKSKYYDALTKGAPPLNFTLYVPTGYRELEGGPVPNVEETEDPQKLFTAHFKEVW